MFAIVVLLIVPDRAFAEKKVPILVYHSIAEFTGSGQKDLYVTPDNFERQMRYLKEHGYTPLTFERWDEIDRVDKPVFVTIDDGYKNNLSVKAIFEKVRGGGFQPSATLFVISDFIGRRNRLSEADLNELSKTGMFSVQSHTATHPDLTKAVNFVHELKDSKDKIQRITGKPVIALSYPYGNANAKVVAETKKYYQFGLTTTPAPFVKKNVADENFILPRLYVKYSTTIGDFANIVGP
nr:polysaccharide deacetylase family protein [Bacillus sp. FJAT-27225]